MTDERILLVELDGMAQDRLERVVRSFEGAWKRGHRPDIADHLPSEPGERIAVLVELINLDLEYRLKAGERARVESYLDLYPELGDEKEQFLALVEAEYRLRSRREPELTLGEFLERFPRYRPELSDRFGRETAVELEESAATRAEHVSASLIAGGGLALPNYEILGEQGRGSMGVVYRARQRALGRLVALKMILAGPHADSLQRERFRNEAQILARLRHPNIVQIYEVGEHEGRPFLALEFIDGGTLASRLAGTPLPPAEAAHLVRALAQAIQAAHQTGIIHRDLKPANVLIADCGLRIADSQSQLGPQSAIRNPQSAIKIGDFGLAKQLPSEQGHTRSGAVVGTPSYMAPEQARGDTRNVGPAADIYALGAILYELLTGRPPFKGATAMDTMLQVLADEPVPPSRLQPKLPRDLETICLKCLQKRPQRRYTTAQALADDLERFLTHRPIVARPIRWPERIGKWVRREPRAAILTSVIIALSMVAFGLVTWQWQRAAASAKEATKQRDKARDRLVLARTAVDRFYTQVSQSPEMQQRGTEELRTQLLATAAEFYRVFTQEEEGNEPEIRVEQGRGLRRLGELYLSIDRLEQAANAFQRALDIFEILSNEHPENSLYHDDRAATLCLVGGLWETKHRYPEAEQAFQEALSVHLKLAADHPQAPEYRMRLAGCYERLGSVYRAADRNGDAEKVQRKALTIFQGLTSDYPNASEYEHRLATCIAGLSILYANSDRSLEALRGREQALALYDKVVNHQRGNPKYRSDLAACQINLGISYRRAGRAEEAGDLYRQALTILQDLSARHPLVAGFRFMLATAYDHLGSLYRDNGRVKESENAYREALTGFRKLIDDDPRKPEYRNSLATSYVNLGTLYQSAKRSGDAEQAYRQGLAVCGPLAESYPNVTDFIATRGFLYGNLAELLETSTKLPEVLEASDRAITAIGIVLDRQPKYPAARSSLRTVHCVKARTLGKLARHGEAARHWALALKLSSEPERAPIQIQLVCALARSGDHAAALDALHGRPDFNKWIADLPLPAEDTKP